MIVLSVFFFFQAEDGIRDKLVTGVQTCALPIWLGLAFPKSLVEARGGRIGVESVVGQGSTFWVELPWVAAPLHHLELEGQGPMTLSAIGSEGACTILYIEDNLSNLELVERILTRLPDVRLLSAKCGEQGLEMARRNLPDLV